jgi:hypothetical protein
MTAMSDEQILAAMRMIEVGAAIALLGFLLGYASGRKATRVVRIPVDEIGRALFLQQAALA